MEFDKDKSSAPPPRENSNDNGPSIQCKLNSNLHGTEQDFPTMQAH